MNSGSQQLHDTLLATLPTQDEDGLAHPLKGANPADVAEALELLEDVDRSRVLFALDSQTAAEVIVLLDEWLRDEVVDDLSGDHLAAMVKEMAPDDAADVVGELTDEESGDLLERLSDEQSEQIEELLKYGETTAGGLMNPDMLRVPETASVREAIRYLRSADVTDDEALVIFSTDNTARLSGTVSPHRLLISAPDKLLSEILDPNPVCATVDEDQEDVVKLFMKYDVASLPVVDDSGALVGHITADDVLDVAVEEADEDIYHMAGTDPAELETSSIFRAAGIRYVWLMPSFVLMTGTMMVILFSTGWFDSDATHRALIACVPLIGALAGCCSVQTSTVITRGLATGELAGSKLGYVFSREGRIALVLAPICAASAWVLVRVFMPRLLLWEGIELDRPVTTIVNAVGTGMLVAVLSAAMLGITMPFAFRRMGIDPAISAGPIVTAANDVICVSLYLYLAHWVVTMV